MDPSSAIRRGAKRKRGRSNSVGGVGSGSTSAICGNTVKASGAKRALDKSPCMAVGVKADGRMMKLGCAPKGAATGGFSFGELFAGGGRMACSSVDSCRMLMDDSGGG